MALVERNDLVAYLRDLANKVENGVVFDEVVVAETPEVVDYDRIINPYGQLTGKKKIKIQLCIWEKPS